MATVLEDSRRHYQAASVYIVLGMALGTTSYAYSASIIQSTLGKLICRQERVMQN